MAVVRYNGVTPVAGSLVTVYETGTQVIATLYADDLLTPLGNPFTSDLLTGVFSYWADNGTVYDELIGAATAVPATALNTAAFGQLAVTGQPLIEATVPHDAFGLAAGGGVTITTNATTRVATITSTGAGTPSATVSALDGTGNAGASADYSRGDHKHSDANRPVDDEKAALAGTDGTPSVTNPYVTDSDARNTDARTPLSHGSTHEDGQADEISVAGLSGTLADPQTVAVDAAGALVGDGAVATPLAVQVDGSTVQINGSNQLTAPGGGGGITQLTTDVTAGPGSGSQAATIANGAVSYAKMQDVSAASKLLGRGSAAGAGDPEEITLGSGLAMAATTLGVTTTRSIVCTIDGGGVAITAGIKADLYIPVACTILACTMLADQSGTIVVDILKAAYASYPPTVSIIDTGSGGVQPTISGPDDQSQDNTLSHWTTAVSAGDCLRFEVVAASISAITRVVLVLTVTVP